MLLSVKYLGLNEDFIPTWNTFIGELERARVRLTQDQDSLIWSFDEAGGDFIAKLGYKATLNLEVDDAKWWWSKLWKTIASTKTKLLMWHALMGKVLTWIQLLKRGKHGPEICLLCRSGEETNNHLFLHCSYFVQVWVELEYLVGKHSLW